MKRMVWNYRGIISGWVVCGKLPDFSQGTDKKWQDHPYVLERGTRKGLIWRNTGFIITLPTICLCVKGRQVIEGFIDKVGQASPLVIIMSGEDA